MNMFKTIETKQDMNFEMFETVKNVTNKFDEFREKFEDVNDALYAFVAEYSNNVIKDKEGVGAYIVLNKFIPNKKIRPYEIEKMNNGGGTKKFVKVYKWYDEAGICVSKTYTTKGDAFRAIKELYQTGRLKTNATLFVEKEVKEENNALAKAVYSPTEGSQNGLVFIFGNEKK